MVRYSAAESSVSCVDNVFSYMYSIERKYDRKNVQKDEYDKWIWLIYRLHANKHATRFTFMKAKNLSC